MNLSANEAERDTGASSALTLFADEGLPFPPVPALLLASMTQQGAAWFATRPVASTPYDLHHFLDEVETQPDVADYAVVGFDGHGTNSWAVHFYLVQKGIALFIKLPWGGAYLEPEPARARITEMFEWAVAVQSQLQRAESAGKIPPGTRLHVAASRFDHAGWRWVGVEQSAAETPWNPAGGMRAAVLQEFEAVIAGRALAGGSNPQGQTA
ncbi:hypothetical protein AVHY2522_08775 [Acidovorax sp. SUPP2522]|uniref:hypothetical protein n=1 Tax=unclassified Acidovorax TaxID=2684926 RepID=UPI0023495516|nr:MULTISPECIES: hypothetical protein [unclassified Acidovorax]WCM97103.1 hypothetical protein M5C96_22300 [Acidovorax sp. GBBC 1281]GKT15626.1 hypothetical protein AVHY2522_08775 [Acidovorax sp. SUPP2522]